MGALTRHSSPTPCRVWGDGMRECQRAHAGRAAAPREARGACARHVALSTTDRASIRPRRAVVCRTDCRTLAHMAL